MMLGQVISLILLALGLAIVVWAIFGGPSRRALRRKLRKGIAKTERNRKPKSGPPEANGHKGIS